MEIGIVHTWLCRVKFCHFIASKLTTYYYVTLSLTAQSTGQNYEGLKQEHDKKVGLMTKQEVWGVDYLKMEKNRMEMESLESKLLVATQSIDTTTSEIIRLRESELFPQVLELVAGSVPHYHHSSLIHLPYASSTGTSHVSLLPISVVFCIVLLAYAWSRNK